MKYTVEVIVRYDQEYRSISRKQMPAGTIESHKIHSIKANVGSDALIKVCLMEIERELTDNMKSTPERHKTEVIKA